MNMQPVATDRVAWSMSVFLLVTIVILAVMAEPIEMPFGIWTCGDDRAMY